MPLSCKDTASPTREQRCACAQQHDAADGSPSCPPSPTGDTARADQPRGYIQVPRELFKDSALCDRAVVLWCALISLVHPERPTVAPSRAHLAAALGLVDQDAVSALTAALRRAGWLDVQQVRVGEKTRNRYTPLGRPVPGDGRRYVELPRSALAMVATGKLSVPAVRSLCRWADDCGPDRWTSDSLTHHARRHGVSVPTARRHRAELTHNGLLVVEHRAGFSARTLLPGALVGSDGPASAELAPLTSPGTAPFASPGTASLTEAGATPITGPRPNCEPPASRNSRERDLPVRSSRRDLPVEAKIAGRKRRATAATILSVDRDLAQVAGSSRARCVAVLERALAQGADPARMRQLITMTDGDAYERTTAVVALMRAELLAPVHPCDAAVAPRETRTGDRPWSASDERDLQAIRVLWGLQDDAADAPGGAGCETKDYNASE